MKESPKVNAAPKTKRSGEWEWLKEGKVLLLVSPSILVVSDLKSVAKQTSRICKREEPCINRKCDQLLDTCFVKN
jgi:hypothetical protein